MHTTLIPESEKDTAKTRKKPGNKTIKVKRASFSERLLRNTAVACALLLSVMALKNIDTPFTHKVTDTIRTVVNMDFEIDKSIGELSFVQKVMPKSALVFLNMSSKDVTPLPVSGSIFHVYTQSQPWTEFTTEPNENILSVSDGTVKACVRTESSDWTILVQHNDGTEAVYAYIKEPLVSSGDCVSSKTPLGISGEQEDAHLYFEYRVNGKSHDPSEILKGYEQ